MKKIITKLAVPLYTALISTGSAFADQINNPLGTSCFSDLLDRIIGYIFIFSIPICSIAILWGGFLLLTSMGEASKIETGKKAITWAIFGFVIVILAKGSTLIIKDLLGIGATVTGC